MGTTDGILDFVLRRHIKYSASGGRRLRNHVVDTETLDAFGVGSTSGVREMEITGLVG